MSGQYDQSPSTYSLFSLILHCFMNNYKKKSYPLQINIVNSYIVITSKSCKSKVSWKEIEL